MEEQPATRGSPGTGDAMFEILDDSTETCIGFKVSGKLVKGSQAKHEIKPS
jgi:hypothetical protein